MILIIETLMMQVYFPGERMMRLVSTRVDIVIFPLHQFVSLAEHDIQNRAKNGAEKGEGRDRSVSDLKPCDLCRRSSSRRKPSSGIIENKSNQKGTNYVADSHRRHGESDGRVCTMGIPFGDQCHHRRVDGGDTDPGDS